MKERKRKRKKEYCVITDALLINKFKLLPNVYEHLNENIPIFGKYYKATSQGKQNTKQKVTIDSMYKGLRVMHISIRENKDKNENTEPTNEIEKQNQKNTEEKIQ